MNEKTVNLKHLEIVKGSIDKTVQSLQSNDREIEEKVDKNTADIAELKSGKADISEIPTIPTSLPANGGNADTLENYTVEQLIRSNRNLLDNPDFKINQRGVDTVTSDGTRWKYTVDRFRTLRATVHVTDNGIRFISDKDSTADYKRFSQITTYPVKKDEYVTVSMFAKVNEVSGITQLRMFNGSTMGGKNGVHLSKTDDYKLFSVSMAAPEDYTKMAVELLVNKDAYVDIDVKWMHANYGSVRAPFVSPDPTLELLKCQRYCIALAHDVVREYTMNSNTLYFIIPLSTPLRVLPSIESETQPVIKEYGTRNIISDFTYSFGYSSFPPKLFVTANKQDHGIPVGTGGILQIPADTRCILSADL